MTKEDSSVRIELGIDEVPTNFPTIQDFYKMSRIPDLHKFYENCMLMSIKSSNNQNIIDELPFWKFIILSKGLDKYIPPHIKAFGNFPPKTLEGLLAGKLPDGCLWDFTVFSFIAPWCGSYE